jgi:hypothetical protein
MDGLLQAMRQRPDKRGRRRVRIGVIRATYPKLRSTTMKTIEDWLPPELGAVKQTIPPTGSYVLPLPDGTTAYLDFVFIALEKASDTESLKSLEVSQFWVNEAAEVDEAVVQMAISRVGRYPSKKDGPGCDFPGVMMDFNLVSEAHWLRRWSESKGITVHVTNADGTDTDVEFPLEYFQQPAAVFCMNYEQVLEDPRTPPVYEVNPNAENKENLPIGYYDNMLKHMSWDQVQAFLLMKWVPVNTGKLVFGRDFSKAAHVGKVRTTPVAGSPVMIGIDTSGLHPAAVFGQLQAGTLVVMDECYGEDMAFEQFIGDVLTPLIVARYQGFELQATCDPSNPRDARTGVTPVQQLMARRIRAMPASTNTFSLRRAAVARLLLKRDGLVIDPACAMLVKGFEEGYVFKKLKGTTTSGAGMYSDQAAKNEYSHFMDALQYLCLPVARVTDDAVQMLARPIPKLHKRRFI